MPVESLRTQVIDLDRTVGNLREDFGGFRADLTTLKGVASRIEGKLESLQQTMHGAQRAQDDRINKIYSRLGAQDAVQGAVKDGKGRWHNYASLVMGGIAGGVVGLIDFFIRGH
jgi:hypothetical protein